MAIDPGFFDAVDRAVLMLRKHGYFAEADDLETVGVNAAGSEYSRRFTEAVAKAKKAQHLSPGCVAAQAPFAFARWYMVSDWDDVNAAWTDYKGQVAHGRHP